MRYSVGVTMACIGLVAIWALLAATPVAHHTNRVAYVPVVCDQVAQPHATRPGQDDEALERMLRSLRPGQTACLRAGTYVGAVKVSSSEITLRSYPGESARIVGRLWFPRIAHDDVIADLRLDGQNPAGLPSPTVNGTRITFSGVDVTNRHSGICFDIGSSRYGRATGVVIQHSRVHGCGRLPANNTEHGIYVSTATETRIVSNLIYDNADRGIQLYPDAQHTLIERNVIDGNGEGIIFSGAEGTASSYNVVEHNLITGSKIRADVESWYPAGNRVGVANVVRNNCLFGGHALLGEPAHGYRAISNIVADPHYADPLKGNFRVSNASPCAQVLSG